MAMKKGNMSLAMALGGALMEVRSGEAPATGSCVSRLTSHFEALGWDTRKAAQLLSKAER